MLSAFDIFMVVTDVIMFTSGITLNSSVIIVYFMDWRKNQRFSVSDQILLSMAFTNISLQCMVVTNGLLYCLWTDLLIFNKGYLYIFIFQFFLIYGSFWHTAWLSVYYCLKLVNWSHDFFLHLKNRLSPFIPRLLLISLVGLFINNLPFVWTVDLEIPLNGTTDPSMKNVIFQLNYKFIVFNVVVGSCLPFLTTFICIGCSVGSLLGHVWRMKQKASLYSSSPQLNVHVRASKTMIAQFLLNFIMYFSIIVMWLSSFNTGILWQGILLTIITSYPSAQTVTLILGNPKVYSRLFGQYIPYC